MLWVQGPHTENYWPRKGLLRWHSGKESVCQCRRCKRHGSISWSGRSAKVGNGSPLRVIVSIPLRTHKHTHTHTHTPQIKAFVHRKEGSRQSFLSLPQQLCSLCSTRETFCRCSKSFQGAHGGIRGKMPIRRHAPLYL